MDGTEIGKALAPSRRLDGGPHGICARPLVGWPSWLGFSRLAWGVIAAALGSSVLAQVALEGPFRPGTGSWTPVAGGGFEVPAGPLVSRVGYVLDGKWFLMTSAGSGGTASVDSVAAARGTNGVAIMPGTFDGPGIGLTLGATFRLPVGVPHVVSAWVRRPRPFQGAAEMYLDLWDAPGDIQVPIPDREGWQFVYGVFTPTVAPVGIRAVIDGKVTPQDELHVDEIAITPLGQFLPPEQDQPLFNVRFGIDATPILRGPAAIGLSPSDHWNAYSRDDGAGGFKPSGGLAPLLAADGKPSKAGLVVDNAPGAWGSGAQQPLMSLYLYSLSANPRVTLTFTNLPTGTYDAYLYGHGGPPDSYNTAFTVESGSLAYGTRTTTTNAGWRLAAWAEGNQYVRFTNVFVAAHQPLRILADRDAQYVASVNGVQLVLRRSEKFQVIPESRFFSTSIDVRSMADLGLALRYTTDGTAPTTNSPALGDLLTITNTTTLLVQAFEGSQPVSVVTRREYLRSIRLDDGIPLDWRTRYFGTNLVQNLAAEGTADPDADGTTNLQEYRAGTSPVDPLEGFATGVRLIPAIQWNSVVGVTYRILRKDRLSDREWIEIRRVQATGKQSEIIDETVDGLPRFYRVEAVR